VDDGRTVGCALVVGAISDDHKVGRYDVQAMEELLRARNFAVDVRTGARATRDGILAGYDELISRARPGAPAVFYYTGHGFREPAGIEQGKYWQAICPTDSDETTETDFHGITSWELSIKQAELTRKTTNVTVILDCCFAAQMSRDGVIDGVRPKSLPLPSKAGFDAHRRALRERYGAAFDQVDPAGSRDAVRLVACAQNECAGTYAVKGEYRSIFTDALVEVLRELGDTPVSWDAILPAIRARVRRRSLTQSPQAEGPARRRLFCLTEEGGSEAAAITAVPDGFRIEAGRLLGVNVGDVFAVMASAIQRDPAAAVARVTVREVSAMSATAELLGGANDLVLPDGAIAIPIKRAAAHRAVRIDVPAAMRAAVETAITATSTLQIAAPDDAMAMATLRLNEGVLTVEDPLGRLFTATGIPEAIQNLTNLRAAEVLRELEGEHGVLATELDIEWGVVVRGQTHRMPAHGWALGLADRVYVTVRTRASRVLCVHIFNIGLQGNITLLTSDDPTGIVLDGERPELVFGQGSDGELLGCEPDWPEGVSRDGPPRLDELVVIVTSIRTSLRALETVEPGETSGGSARGGQLADLFGQLGNGLPRNARAIDGFFVKRLSCFLHPRDTVTAGTALEGDGDPRSENPSSKAGT
jgi:hypothetical protein